MVSTTRNLRLALVFSYSLFFGLAQLLAQNQEIDSLKQVLLIQSPDSNKVNTQLELAFKYLSIDSKTALQYAREAEILSDRIAFTRGQAQATRNIGLAYLYQGELDSSQVYLKAAGKLAQKHNHKQVLADVYNSLAHTFVRRSMYDSAKMIYLKSRDLFEELGNEEGVAISYSNLGVIYSEQGKYSKSLELLQRALSYYIEKDLHNNIANTYHNIASIYNEQGNSEKALEYYIKTSTYDSITGNKSGRAQTLTSIGNILRDEERLIEAKKNYLLALSLATESNSNCSKIMPLTQLGEIQMTFNELDKAFESISQAKELAEQCEMDRYLTSVLKDLATYYQLVGNTQQAEQVLLQGLKLAEENEITPKLQELSHELYKLYKSQNKSKLALEYLESSRLLEQQLFNEKNTEEITRLEAEYEFEKEKEALAVEQREKQQDLERKLVVERILLSGALVVILLLAVVASFAYRSYRIKRKGIQLLADKNEKLKELREKEHILSEEALRSKDRELATMAMASHEKNALLKDMEQKISFIEGRMDDEMKGSLKAMKKSISDSYALDQSWDSFLHKFEDVHPQFFDKLKQGYPVLTIDDLKLSAYLKIGMSNKEIANVTHLTLGSVKSKINRLKKKLAMGPSDNVRDYMIRVV